MLADDPSLTVRPSGKRKAQSGKILRRIVLDSEARTPVSAKVVSDEFASRTTVVVTKNASAKQLARLREKVSVWVAPVRRGAIDLRWLVERLGAENVTHLLVEGGGEANASFLFGGFAHRVAFFYAPKIIGGREARKGVAGDGVKRLEDALHLDEVDWQWLGEDLLLTARVLPREK